jgi:hypothetical protein
MSKTISVCTDCFMVAGNGAWDAELYGYPLPTPAPLSNVDAGYMVHLLDGDIEPYFSHYACDGCRSPLAGNRVDIGIEKLVGELS